MPKYEGWYADTTLFADGHIEFYVFDPDGLRWGMVDSYAIFKGEIQPYVVPKRKAKRIDKIVCRKIKDCHAQWLKKHALAEHVKVEC